MKRIGSPGPTGAQGPMVTGLTDTEIEAGLTDTLGNEIARSLCTAHGMSGKDFDAGAGLDLPARMVAQMILTRLRAGGISDVVLRQVLVTDPNNAHEYYRDLAHLQRQLEAARGDRDAERQITIEILRRRMVFNGRWGKGGPR